MKRERQRKKCNDRGDAEIIWNMKRERERERMRERERERELGREREKEMYKDGQRER